MSIKGWHPLTRLLLLVAVPAVPYLLWTGAGGPSVQRSVSRDLPAEQSAPADPAAPPPAEAPTLPPLEAFTDMVERPLFAATRRPPPPPEARPAAAPRAPQPEALPEPQFQLVGTVAGGERVFALVLPADGGSVLWLGEGDRIDGWEIVEVGANHLVVRQDGEDWRLDILR